jgi:hypothetical protein
LSQFRMLALFAAHHENSSANSESRSCCRSFCSDATGSYDDDDDDDDEDEDEVAAEAETAAVADVDAADEDDEEAAAAAGCTEPNALSPERFRLS